VAVHFELIASSLLFLQAARTEALLARASRALRQPGVSDEECAALLEAIRGALMDEHMEALKRRGWLVDRVVQVSAVRIRVLLVLHGHIITE
jgi:hypothetical protein